MNKFFQVITKKMNDQELNQPSLENSKFLDDNCRTTILSCLIVFLAQTATTIYLPSLPIVMKDLNITKSIVELSISIFIIGAAAPVLFFGIAADKFGRKVSIVCALLLFVLCSVLLSFTTTKEGLLLLRFFQGVGAGGSAIIARIIIRDRWTGDDLARKLSVLSMAFITALGGGQFVGGLIGKFSSWEFGFGLMALTGIIAILLSFNLPMAKKNQSQKNESILGIYFKIFRRRNFLFPTCVGGLGFAITVILQQMSPFLFQKHFGLSVVTHGNIGLLIGIAYFSGAMIVNRTVSKLGSNRLLLTGTWIITFSTLSVLSLWAAGVLINFNGLIIFIVIYCATIFGQAVLFPNSMALAVSSSKSYGAYSVALCGFFQQSIAGVAAVILALGNHEVHIGIAWAVFIFALSVLALMLAIQNDRQHS